MIEEKTIFHKHFLLYYGGAFTQSLIAGMTGVLEKEIESQNLSMKISNNIFVVFIELAQNIMHYAKKIDSSSQSDPKGSIHVVKKEDTYVVCSENIISSEDKNNLESILTFLQTASIDEIKQQYKQQRKLQRNNNAKGAGLGFLEIAKKAKSIEYKFESIKESTFFYFQLCVKI